MIRAPRMMRLLGGALLTAAAGAMLYWGILTLVGACFATSSADTKTESASTTAIAPSAAELAKAVSTTRLQSIVDSMTTSYGSGVALVVTDLSNDATASANADTQFVSASIYKLFVAYGIYRDIDDGTVSASETLTAYGTSSSVEECLDLMLTISDNTCGVALGARYGWSSLDEMLMREGYAGTQLDNYDAEGYLDSDKLTTANDVAKLLKSLYDGTLLSASSTKQFITLLVADEINYMLPSGLPSGTVVAHKVGYLEDYQHDAGIIYGASGDMLVVMLTKDWTTPTTEAAAVFGALGSAVWSYMTT